MNFLAHAYLSFEDPQVLTGNMISDFVKGKVKWEFAPRIRAGIDLHRAIDTFTDENAVTKEAAYLFRPAYGRYRLAFMDVVYDHFLAVELAGRLDILFADFVQSVYHSLEQHQSVFPSTFQSMFPYMRRQNWLFNYQFHSGVAKSFEGLVHRARYLESDKEAMVIFEDSYSKLQEAYHQFFPQLLAFSLKKFADIH